MSLAKISPFFIIGNPRSGTSLFRLMLNYHSQVVVPPECGYIQWLSEKYSTATDWSESIYREIVGDIVASRRFDSWDICSGEILDFLLEQAPISYAEVCACVHQLYAIRAGKMPLRWGDKNNYYLHHLDLLQSLYPDAKYLFITRDPRDVFCSYRALGEQEGRSEFAPNLTVSTSAFCEEWLSNYHAINALRLKLDSSRGTFEVRYEDLVTSPRETIGEVFDYLGLAMEDSVLDYYKDRSNASIEPEISISWKMKTRSAPDPNNVGKYKDVLSKSEQEEISTTCCNEMELLGYS